MIVLSDLVAGVTNREVIRMCLSSWFTTQRGSLTMQLSYITLSHQHTPPNTENFLSPFFTYLESQTLSLFIPLFLTFRVDMCKKTTVFLIGQLWHLHDVRFRLPIICLHWCCSSKHSKIFTLRHTCSWLLLKWVFLFLEFLLMTLQFKTCGWKMLLNLMCYLMICYLFLLFVWFFFFSLFWNILFMIVIYCYEK